MTALDEAQPEKLRAAPMKVRPIMVDQQRWHRLTHRDYLLYLIGAIQRMTFGDSWNDDARALLVKLDGLGGQW